MIERVKNCQGCGQRPCFNCMEVVYTCDCCDKEVDELYDLDGKQMCDKCYMKESFSSLTKHNKSKCINCCEVEKTYSLAGDTDRYCKHCMTELLRDNREVVTE